MQSLIINLSATSNNEKNFKLPSFVNYLEKFRRNKVKKETIIIKTMIF